MPGQTELSEFPEELVDDLNNSFLSLKQIGVGGYGVVLSGVHKDTKKSLVVKVVNLKEKIHEVQFKNEIKLLKKLNHPNICKVYASKKKTYKLKRQCSSSTYGFYTMEKMDSDLLDYILSNPITSKTKLQAIFKAVCKGVQHCHSKGIVHLDIKPDNVLVKMNARGVIHLSEIQLCDFGSAKKVSPLKNGEFIPVVTSGKFGTFQYLPPECMEQFDPSSPIRLDKVDIYSLGVLLFVISTNTFPKLYSEDGCKNLLMVNDFEKIKSISYECYDLVTSMMHENASLRPSISAVLAHPFFRSKKIIHHLRF